MKDKIMVWYNMAKMYAIEVWTEVNPKTGKVSWPNKKMIFGSTIVVIVCVVIVSFYIYVVDIISITIVEKVVGRR